MAMTEPFFTVKEAAQALKIHPATLRGWLRRGILHAAKLGGVWRISQTELDRIRAGTK